jgi:hypothetical protein
VSHTLKVLAGGFALLALCLFLGRVAGSSVDSTGLALGAKLFIPLWFLAAAFNLWFGVSRAGYTLAEEAPIFVVVFTIPVAAALLLQWIFSR